MKTRGSQLILLALVVGAALAGCRARQDFPEAAAGWHAADYGVVFGRLVRVAGADADDTPTWRVRFGERREAYGGELALTPGAMMAGFSGGEPVEVRGKIVGEAGGGGSGDAMKGIHYVVESIRLWSGYRE